MLGEVPRTAALRAHNAAIAIGARPMLGIGDEEVAAGRAFAARQRLSLDDIAALIEPALQHNQRGDHENQHARADG